DLAAEQSEAAVDVSREDRQELVDNAGIVHFVSSCWPKKRRRFTSHAAVHSGTASTATRHRARTPSLGVDASAREIWEADAPGAGGETADASASVRTNAPSTATATIFAVRPMSVLPAEAPEALAGFGLGGCIAR